MNTVVGTQGIPFVMGAAASLRAGPQNKNNQRRPSGIGPWTKATTVGVFCDFSLGVVVFLGSSLFAGIELSCKGAEPKLEELGSSSGSATSLLVKPGASVFSADGRRG